MASFAAFLVTALALISSFALTALKSALDHMPRSEASTELERLGMRFFYLAIQRRLLGDEQVEVLKRALYYCIHLSRFVYVFIAGLLCWTVVSAGYSLELAIGLAIATFVILLVLGDLLPKLWGRKHPSATIGISAPFTSIPLILTLPLTYTIVSSMRRLQPTIESAEEEEISGHVKERILELIESNRPEMSTEDRKLIESVLTFRSRIVREVMTPRVDVFCLPIETTIEDAASQLRERGFSRVPVYRQNIDSVVGLLMYRDILATYMETEGDWSQVTDSVKTILKPVMYTPETKKISQLLQEFRSRQMHMAVVVDEYGGTAGIVTIEDVLEELVGEIADEYDNERRQFQSLPTGGWIADARMSIIDVEEQLGIKIPQDGDYDTIGGYIFHRAGTIPSEGFIVQHENFEIKILKSDERKIEKVTIVPLLTSHSGSTNEDTDSNGL